jgi:pimeloyl-ACP methyl ester carboxylesterase
LERFTASDGVSIAFEAVGLGRPLVLLHGLMAHRGFFEAQRPLASDFQLIAVDLRGHGDSRALGSRLDVDRVAADVAELVEHLNLTDAIGIGWSLGASILWQVLASPASSRFSGAVVVDMTARVLNGGDWQLGLSPDVCDARSAAIRDDYASFALAAGQNIFAQPVAEGKRELAAWAGGQFALNDPAAMGAVWASLVSRDDRQKLPTIGQPTLIVHGGKSQLYGPATAQHLAGALPNARIVTFESSGHAPHMEQPELFNATIREFAASLPRVRETQSTA